jgi:hypothetical protein
MGFVYALQETRSGYFKIGIAKDVEKRIKALHTGRAERLDVFCEMETPWASTCETYIHDRLENESGSRRVLEGAGTEFFAVSPETLHRVFAEAEEFVSDLKEAEAQVLELTKVEPSSDLISADEAFREVAEDLRKIQKQISLLTWRKEFLENQLKVAIGTHEGIKGVATWKSQLSKRFQQSDFKEEHPELFERFVAVTRTRFFRLSKDLRK